MNVNEWPFAKAIQRQLYTADVASFFIVQERSTNVLCDLTVKDTDGTVYEIKDEATASLHEEMLRTLGLSFHYTARDRYVFYHRRPDGEAQLYVIPTPIE